MTIQMNATEQYFPMVLFIMLYKVAVTFVFEDEMLWCNPLTVRCSVVLSYDAVCFSLFRKIEIGICLGCERYWKWKQQTVNCNQTLESTRCRRSSVRCLSDLES